MDNPESLSLALPDGTKVSALLQVPEDARALYVFAHGAGAGMLHAGMSSFADALAAANVATSRYQFPYMERGSKRVDSPAAAHAAVRAAVAEARRRLPALPLFAGGRSFGGRMTSQAQAISPLDGVRGLAFIAFPLHPAGKPGVERAQHLADVKVPMLFLQGTRDKLAELPLTEVGCRAPEATRHAPCGGRRRSLVPRARVLRPDRRGGCARTGTNDVGVVPRRRIVRVRNLSRRGILAGHLGRRSGELAVVPSPARSVA